MTKLAEIIFVAVTWGCSFLLSVASLFWTWRRSPNLRFWPYAVLALFLGPLSLVFYFYRMRRRATDVFIGIGIASVLGILTFGFSIASDLGISVYAAERSCHVKGAEIWRMDCTSWARHVLLATEYCRRDAIVPGPAWCEALATQVIQRELFLMDLDCQRGHIDACSEIQEWQHRSPEPNRDAHAAEVLLRNCNAEPSRSACGGR